MFNGSQIGTPVVRVWILGCVFESSNHKIVERRCFRFVLGIYLACGRDISYHALGEQEQNRHPIKHGGGASGSFMNP